MMLETLKKLDSYPKVNEDFFTKTRSGGFITIVSLSVMVVLFWTELLAYVRVRTSHELQVDLTRKEKLEIHFNITFHSMPCSALNIDVMDVSGEQHLDVDHDLSKQRINQYGVPVAEMEKGDVGVRSESVVQNVESECQSCFGAESETRKCCNTCEELKEAYLEKRWNVKDIKNLPICRGEDTHIHEEFRRQVSQKEGCNIMGLVETSKVAGNFHFAPGKAYQQGSMHFHDLAPFQGTPFDVSHTIHKLAFGAEYPGQVNPLDGALHRLKEPNGMYQYFLKVVPTSYTDLKGKQVRTNQFSVTEHYKQNPANQAQSVVPGVFFFYEFSPLMVDVIEEGTSFLHFITSLLAILGGVFTVAGMVDGVVYHGHLALKRKMELGKLS